MESKTALAWLKFIGTAIIVAFFAAVILLPNDPAVSSAQSPVLPEPTQPGLPIRLEIPSIKVNAAVLPVGLTSDGAMGVPEGPADTAWFDRGPRPGETGSAVIDGHFGWKDNIPAAFDNLNELHPGDKIFVENDRGETVTFVVRELRTLGENGNAADVFTSSDGEAHLNLITCEGVWNAATKSYSERLVVFADKESSTTADATQ